MLTNEFYSQDQQGPYSDFALGDFALEQGGVLPHARLAYATLGELNSRRDNAVLFPHMFSGTCKHMQMYVAPGMALDPARYFVIFPNMLGNGLSSSPHNSPPPIAMADFPPTTIGDDVRAQQRLVTEHFGIETLELVLGWSMGAQQTFEWAVRYPAMVRRAAAIAGTARGTAHNHLLVANAINMIEADPAWAGGNYRDPHAVATGLKLLAHFFAMIGLTKAFYRDELWRGIGFSSYEGFMTGFWEAWFAPMDANALRVLLLKWQHADVSRHTGGDLAAALARIEAQVFNMPFADDLMFTVEECAVEHALTPHSEFRPIPTPWGHFGMLGIAEADKQRIDSNLRDLLALKV